MILTPLLMLMMFDGYSTVVGEAQLYYLWLVDGLWIEVVVYSILILWLQLLVPLLFGDWLGSLQLNPIWRLVVPWLIPRRRFNDYEL